MILNNIERISLTSYIHNHPIRTDKKRYIIGYNINRGKYCPRYISLDIRGDKCDNMHTIKCDFGYVNYPNPEDIYNDTDYQINYKLYEYCSSDYEKTIKQTVEDLYKSTNSIKNDFLKYIPFNTSTVGFSNFNKNKVSVGSTIDVDIRRSEDFKNIEKTEDKVDSMVHRISMTVRFKNNIFDIGYTIPDYLKSYLSDDIRCYDSSGEYDDDECKPNAFLMKTKIIKYNNNDFFDWHIDAKSGYTHMYTLLIYPPYSICKPYTGGELVLLKGNKEHAIDPKKFEKWTTIILDLNTQHCVNKITYDTNNTNNNLIERIVIKSELHFSEYILKLWFETKIFDSCLDYKYPELVTGQTLGMLHSKNYDYVVLNKFYRGKYPLENIAQHIVKNYPPDKIEKDAYNFGSDGKIKILDENLYQHNKHNRQHMEIVDPNDLDDEDKYVWNYLIQNGYKLMLINKTFNSEVPGMFANWYDNIKNVEVHKLSDIRRKQNKNKQISIYDDEEYDIEHHDEDYEEYYRNNYEEYDEEEKSEEEEEENNYSHEDPEDCMNYRKNETRFNNNKLKLTLGKFSKRYSDEGEIFRFSEDPEKHKLYAIKSCHYDQGDYMCYFYHYETAIKIVSRDGRITANNIYL